MEPTKENIENPIKLINEELESKPLLLYNTNLSIFWKEFSQSRESIFKIIYNILEEQGNDDINEELKKNNKSIDYNEELFNEEENESKECEEESNEEYEENFNNNLEYEIELIELEKNKEKKSKKFKIKLIKDIIIIIKKITTIIFNYMNMAN